MRKKKKRDWDWLMLASDIFEPLIWLLRLFGRGIAAIFRAFFD
jgi:hypothetical protein